MANLVTVPVGRDGKVSISSANGTTDVIFDVVGSYALSDGVAGSRFHGITPVRFLDTRVPRTPVGPGGTLSMKFTGAGGVPVERCDRGGVERHGDPADVVGVAHRLPG